MSHTFVTFLNFTDNKGLRVMETSETFVSSKTRRTQQVFLNEVICLRLQASSCLDISSSELRRNRICFH